MRVCFQRTLGTTAVLWLWSRKWLGSNQRSGYTALHNGWHTTLTRNAAEIRGRKKKIKGTGEAKPNRRSRRKCEECSMVLFETRQLSYN
jgi:hypothetical protein